MTKIETWDSVNNDVNKTNKLFTICNKWYSDDEKNETAYLQEIKRELSLDAIKILKRPFSFIVKCDDGYIQIGVKVSGGAMKSFAQAYKGIIKNN